MIAVICPVCNGVGQVSAGFYSRGGDCLHWVSSGLSPELCRSCDGKGWVEVHEEPYHSSPMTLPELYPGLQPLEAWPEPTLYPGSITYVP